MQTKTTIDVKDYYPKIDIMNLSWGDYSHLMISIDNLISQLENPIEGDLYLDDHRKGLLSEYKELFEKLKSTPWRGQAESLDDMVISAIQKSNKS